MARAVSEEAILQALRQVLTEPWPDVLHYLSSLQVGTAAAVEPAILASLADTTWIAVGLQQWPRPVQDAVLREQAERLVAHYRRDPDFTEVFGCRSPWKRMKRSAHSM